MRLVLIVKDSYTVFEGSKAIVEYVLEPNGVFPTAKEVEWIRVQEYRELA
jgi:hypothetical protein